MDKIILRGDYVFKLMDSKGLPLDLIIDLLKEKGLAFDVIGFIKAAIESKNFTLETIKKKLLQALRPDEAKEIIMHIQPKHLNYG